MLGWFMSKTQTLTSPPREGEPAGTEIKGTSSENSELGKVWSVEGDWKRKRNTAEKRGIVPAGGFLRFSCQRGKM